MRPGRGVAGALLAGHALAFAVALAWPVWPAVAVSHDDARLGHVPLDADGTFTVAFEHSVDKLPVYDTFTLRDGAIVLDSTRLRQFGAGMGHVPGEGTGHAEGEWWVVSGIDRPADPLLVRVGAPTTEHRLLHAAGETPLSPCWAGERLTFEAVRESTLARLLPTARTVECAAETGEGTRR